MKENFSVNVSALADYVNQVGSGEIIAKLAGSARTIGYLAQQAGVNAPTDLHLMEVAGSFGDGKNCNLNDNTSFTFTDRQLVPAFVKQESVICGADFIGKWMSYKERFTASDNEIPFEAALIDAFAENVGENLENWIWNGGTIGSTNYDGLVDIVEADGTQVKAGSTADTYEMIEALIMAIPSKQAGKTEIFVSPATMKELKRDLLKRDFRLIDLGGFEDKNTISMPVYDVLVHAVDGLAGNAKAYALVPEHTVYGYSVDGAHTDVKAIYDEVNDKHILRAKLAVATQIAYPSEAFYAEKVD